MGALRQWAPPLAVVMLIAVASFAASITGLPLERAPLTTPAAEQTGPPQPEPSRSAALTDEATDAVEGGSKPPSWLAVSVTGAVVVALVLVLLGLRPLLADMFAAHRFRRRPVRDRTVPRPARPEQEIVAALDAGLLDLDDADLDPRRAVIACWVRLEQTAAAVGLPARPGDTSTDLVLRLLSGRAVSEQVLVGFADVFRRARYATHDVDEGMRRQARSALERLRDELVAV